MKISVSQIDVNFDWNCRNDSNLDIEQLAQSISQHGLLTPITLMRSGDRYRLIAGFRRIQAVKLLEWDEIECTVTDCDNELDAMCINLVENVERRDLTFYEEARGIEPLVAQGLGREEIAGRLNRTPGWVQWRTQAIEVCNRSEKIDLWTREGAFTQEDTRRMYTILTHFTVSAMQAFAIKLKAGEKPPMPIIPGKKASKRALNRAQIQDAMGKLRVLYGDGPHSYALAFASGEIDIEAFCLNMDQYLHWCPNCAECIEAEQFHSCNRA